MVEESLFDDGNQLATNGKEVGWDHLRISD